MIVLEVWICGVWLPVVLSERDGETIAYLQVGIAYEGGETRTDIARIELPPGAAMRRRAA